MASKKIEGYSLDGEDYYVSNEICQGLAFPKKCPQCEDYLHMSWREKYLNMGGFLVLGDVEILHYECPACKYSFLPNEDD